MNTTINFLLKPKQKKEIKQFGIYKIGFKNNNNFYIGSTTITFYRRLGQHLKLLEKNIHINKKLQNYYNKYKDIYFEIIEICNEKQNCIKREQYYIDILKPKLNICKIAGSTLGFKPTHHKKIDMFDLNGVLINTYLNMTDCFRKTNICPSCIRYAIIKKGIASNFQFRYAGKFKKLPAYENPLALKINQYDLNGNWIKTWNSLLELSNTLNIPVGNISKHINNKDNTSKCYNFIFKKYEKNFNLKIDCYKQNHSCQMRVLIKNVENNKILFFNSLRSINTSIITRCTITIKRKMFGDIFYYKNKYLIQIITCINNENIETQMM